MWEHADLHASVTPTFPARASGYPRLRYMGSKHRLLPWIWETVAPLSFDSALDLFSGSGSVAYLFKCMGKRVIANDYLRFARDIAAATIVNDATRLPPREVDALCTPTPGRPTFIADTFDGIFFTPADLRFLDDICARLETLADPAGAALARAALTRACLKRQPRGVFTVAGDKYDDGRRDLMVPVEQHFRKAVAALNALVFDNGRRHVALNTEALTVRAPDAELVYMDPPYVPRADDNCYMKRYHFVEGLASYWRAPGLEIDPRSRVRKLRKRLTPFASKKTAPDAFRAMFRRFGDRILVLSYSSNGYPDLASLVSLMKRYKRHVDVVEREHRYSFGTHSAVHPARATVREYLIVGT